MTETQTYALKTFGGGIQYSITRYKDSELSEYDLTALKYYLELPETFTYCIEQTATGFRFSTKDIEFNYFDSAYHENRVVTVRQRN